MGVPRGPVQTFTRKTHNGGQGLLKSETQILFSCISNYVSPTTWANQPINGAKNLSILPINGGTHVYMAFTGSSPPPAPSAIIQGPKIKELQTT